MSDERLKQKAGTESRAYSGDIAWPAKFLEVYRSGGTYETTAWSGELEVPAFFYAKISILWNIPLPVRIAAKRFR